MVIFLSYKYDTLTNFEAFCRTIQREEGYFITSIHIDHDGKFENTTFEEFCAQNVFTQNFCLPISPQQNEVVKIRIVH